MKINAKTKILIIKSAVILFAFCIFVLIVKGIKHSAFIEALHQANNSEEHDYPNVAKQDSTEYSYPVNTLYFDSLSDQKQIGKTITLTDSNSNYYYNVNYPATGISTIDELLKNNAETELSAYLGNISDYVAENSGMRAGLTIDYQSYLTGDSLLSVVFTIIYDSPQYTNPLYTVRTHNFLLKSGEEIPLSNLLAGKYEKYLSSKVAEHLKADANLKQTMNESTYADNYSAHADNFNKYAFSNSGLTLYYNPYEIASGEYGIISVFIPAKDIYPFIIYDPFKQVDIIPQPAPTEQPSSLCQTDIDPEKPMIALTFDDGPRAESTNAILDVLEQYNCRASFFVLGSRAANEKTTLKRAAALGCDIGNHSYSHTRLSTLNKKGRIKEIAKTNNVLKKLINKKARFVRTPYGQTAGVTKHINYPIILWNVDTEDWKTLKPKKIIKAATGNIKDGDIILMHDIYNSTAQAVETIVPRLLKKGYQLVTISELFKYRNTKPKKHKAYFNVTGK